MSRSTSLFRLSTRASSSSSAPNSVSGTVSTLIPSLIVAVVLVGLFLALRVKAKRVYQPRTYLSVFRQHQRTPTPSQTRFGWFKDFWSLPDEYVLSHHSLDGYLYLRFWRLLATICLAGALITWPILLPVYGTAGGGQKQFDKISFANASHAVNRFYATALIAWVFLGLVAYLIGKEAIFYTYLRHRYLLSRHVASRLSSRTVLFTNIPHEYMSESALRKVLPLAQHIWFAADSKDIDKLVEDRDKTALKLEAAEVKLCKAAEKKRRKNIGKSGADCEDPMRWAEEKKRPTHRLKPIIGKKVDTIDWSREHLQELSPQVESQKEMHLMGSSEKQGAAFVEFENVQAAEGAFRSVVYSMPEKMVPRAIGAKPKEIVWTNLGMGEGQRKVRHIAAVFCVVFLILIWAPLTAFIGAVSNVQNLATEVPFLSFILKIPTPLLGIVTGLLPVVLLAVLMMLVPILMRKLSKLAGAATLSEIELDTQSWYFAFQIIIVFLITTFASGAAAVASQISKDPTLAPALLAANLPKASNFYINYFVLYGVASSAKLLSNAVALLMYTFVGKYLDSTPRKIYLRYTKVAGLQWGSVYPPFTMLAVIAISYSCIAPLIMAFATIAFYLLYWAARYNMLYALDTTAINQQGAGFEKALNHLLTGIYLSELCLIGLFSIDTASSPSTSGPLVLMLILLALTIIYHIFLRRTALLLRKSNAHDLLTQQISHDHHHDDPSDDEPVDKWDITGNSPDDIALRAPAEHARDRRLGEPRGWLTRILAPAWIPALEPCLNEPVRDYTEQQRQIAYLNPSVVGPPPTLWIVGDNVGLARREVKETSRVIQITDEGAWWSEDKGRLTTMLSREETGEADAVREAPIWEEVMEY